MPLKIFKYSFFLSTGVSLSTSVYTPKTTRGVADQGPGVGKWRQLGGGGVILLSQLQCDSPGLEPGVCGCTSGCQGVLVTRPPGTEAQRGSHMPKLTQHVCSRARGRRGAADSCLHVLSCCATRHQASLPPPTPGEDSECPFSWVKGGPKGALPPAGSPSPQG